MNNLATTFELLHLLDTLVRQVAYMRHLQCLPVKRRPANYHDAVRMAVAEVDALVALHLAHAVGAELQTPPPGVTDMCSTSAIPSGPETKSQRAKNASR